MFSSLKENQRTTLETNKFIILKPDFHLHFLAVTSETFRSRNAQIDEINESDEKISLPLFIFKVKIFQLLGTFLPAKPIRFLSFLEFSQ